MPRSFFRSLSPLGLPAQTHYTCLIIFDCKLCNGKRSTCHYDTYVAKSQCLGLSSDLGHHRDCLLKPTQSYYMADIAKKKEVLTIAISLDLSSDLCRHRYCLLKPATWSIILDCKTCRHEIWILESLELFSDLFRDWDCLVFADKTIRLYKSSKYRLPSHCVTKASIFFPILIATGTACSNSLYLLNHI